MLASAYSRRLLNGCGVVVHVTAVTGCSLSCCRTTAAGTIDRLTMKSRTYSPQQHTRYKTIVVKIARSRITTMPSFLDVEPAIAAAADR